eukprot:scaffold334311_cov35-Prasinocladus_malaysianus.AAC.1
MHARSIATVDGRKRCVKNRPNDHVRAIMQLNWRDCQLSCRALRNGECAVVVLLTKALYGVMHRSRSSDTTTTSGKMTSIPQQQQQPHQPEVVGGKIFLRTCAVMFVSKSVASHTRTADERHPLFSHLVTSNPSSSLTA